MAERKPQTIGELRSSGYKVLSVKEEMRKNLINKIRNNEVLFEGIVGYEESVIPQVENAILSGQDMVLLGERGQAKSRIARSLINLLDEEIPVIAGCEISDDPYAPICLACRTAVAEHGDDVKIAWLSRDKRYGEKLATPDITIADLIGEVDPIKVAEGRYLSDELTIHYGLIPRTNRGVFCINELPDLAERIQVGLLNIMEERDVQIRGYRVRLPLDIYVVASANPEDYTNRGRIITPLKDRCGSEIRTHYPRDPMIEMDIMEQESTHFEDEGLQTMVPDFMREILAEFTHLARRSPDINQRSGVSVRVSITNLENIQSNAIRRAIRLKENYAVPRISDLPAILASTAGKIELETAEEGREEHVIDKLVQTAVVNVFNRYFRVQDLEPVVASFDQGASVEVSDLTPSREYLQVARQATGLLEAAEKLAGDKNPASVASAVEFLLEGLHLNRKLNKEKVTGKAQYRGHHAFL
ncbi:MAG TPA: magnesium chelatase [Dehalococcoidia bacterium]|nr:magnesium chelatase [Dehalococcoidia bacterium]